MALKVGDNVGDCAARGADLFESIAAEIISAMILGGTMAQRCKIEGKSYAHLVESLTSFACKICILASINEKALCSTFHGAPIYIVNDFLFRVHVNEDFYFI